MEQRLSLVTLGVADLDAARRFYEALGWRASGDSPGVVFFQLLGMALGLWSRREMAADAGADDDGEAGFGGITLAYNARSRAEVDAVLTEAERAGARIARPAAETFWGGYSGYFADPDGHLWEVAHNPAWTLDAAGGVNLR